MSLRFSLGLHSMMISTTEATACLQCCLEQRTVCFKACFHSAFSVGLLEGRLRIRCEHLQRQPMAQPWMMFSEYFEAIVPTGSNPCFNNKMHG